MNWLTTQVSEFFFPDRCLFCEDETDLNSSDYRLICSDCNQLLRPLTTADLAHYHHVYLEKHYQQSIIAVQFDELSQKLLHFVKYHHGIQLANYLGKRIFSAQKHLFDMTYDAILPCPLHPRKFREREFNQAEAIANGLSACINVPVDTHSLQRNRYTKTQTRLNKEERLLNLSNAFSFQNTSKYKHVIIIDDVITTGATLKTIADSINKSDPDLKLTAVSFASPV